MARRLKIENYAIPAGPRLGLRGWARWTWRQITSMRTALILLLLLGVAAIPGGLVPQRPQDPAGARAFVAENGWWGRTLERWGFLDVFGSAWFTAIYLLLFLSLIGCIVPRIVAHVRASRRPPASAPSTLSRFDPRQERVAGEPERVVAELRAVLARRRGWKVRADEAPRGYRLSADQGALREWGNVLFHVALVGILVAVALGSSLSFRAQVVVVEGDTVVNAPVSYDSYEPGRWFSASDLDPFTLTLTDLSAEFDEAGAPLDFTATVAIDGSEESRIRVGRPLNVNGVRVFLQGNGYAPRIEVTDGNGEVVFADAVPFLPQDAAYTSTGVVKIPDVSVGEQIGLRATLLPTAGGDSLASLHPQPVNPVMLVTVFIGDLGLDDGIPQNVYILDDTHLSPVQDDEGRPVVVILAPGQTVDLPDGLGTLTWHDIPRFAAFDLQSDPTMPWLLAAALAAIVGLSVSLFSSQRRIWVLIEKDRGVTVVSAAGSAPDHDRGIGAAVDRLLAAISKENA